MPAKKRTQGALIKQAKQSPALKRSVIFIKYGGKIVIEFKGFTEKANSALNKAVEAAMELGHTYIGSEHILYGLLCEENSAAYAALWKYGITGRDILHKMETVIGRGTVTRLTAADITPRSRKILDNAFRDSRSSGKNFAGTEHILMSVIGDEKCSGAVFLRELGADTGRIVRECASAPHNCGIANAPDREYRSTAIERYGRDLTAMARAGRIDPVIARDSEINAAVRILMRRRRNNPCLIGESGVGKTAIAEGIALLCAGGEAPGELRNARIFSLDLAAMVAGAKYRGDFEERIRSVIDEVRGSRDTILFVDEIHTIVGAGAAEGAIDAANILKPVLARGEIRVIGATTADEYRRFIEKDAALSRRFRAVYVEEPDESAAIDILKGIKEKYEEHHGVTLSDDAIEAAVKLSVRYIEDRRLPDKAIDLIDESCSAARLAECPDNDGSAELKKRIEKLSGEKENAVLAQDFELAAEIRDKEKALAAQYEQRISECADKCRSCVITAEDIARAAADITGISVAEIGRSDAERILHLEDELKQRIIGQDNAVHAVAAAIKRSRAGISRRDRPLGSFIFAGPTGVGKTELSKALTCALFGREDAMIRFDMSEYMEKHSVSGLIGAPAGYVGYEDGGRLIGAVKRHPYSVLLFDEIEKAHPDVLDLLLQVLDEGHITSADGVRVSVKNCIVIMTTNIGARQMTERSAPVGFARESGALMSDTVMAELRKALRPEFINRVDETAVFSPLGEAETGKICRIMLDDLINRVSERGIELEVTDSAVKKLARLGHSDKYGARSMYRTIVKHVEDKLAELILSDPSLKCVRFDEEDI